MAYSHLSLTSEQYDLYISNVKQEEELNETNVSSASRFNTILDPNIDLSSLLYLRSVSAETALAYATINGLPLTYSSTETIQIYITIPANDATCNQSYNSIALEKFNETAYEIQMNDYTTTSEEEAIDCLNEKICLELTNLLLKSYLRIICDIDIFTDEKLNTNLNNKEIRLIQRYLDCVLFSRHVIHKFIAKKLNNPELTNALDSLIKFKYSTAQEKNFTLEWEQDILEYSQLLKKIENRVQPKQNNAINLKLFPEVSVNKGFTDIRPESVKKVIEDDIDNWITFAGILEYIEGTVELTQDSITNIHKILEANKNLILLTLKCRQIITLQDDIKKKKGPFQNQDQLFNGFLLLFTIENDKLKLELNESLFLTNTSVKIVLPPQVSYVLGSKDREPITIGPLMNNLFDPIPKPPVFTKNICYSYQRLFYNIRPMAKMIYVLTDFTSSISRNLWSKKPIYDDFSIVHSFLMDETNTNLKFILKNKENYLFCRISNLKRLLSSITIILVDENFYELMFSVATITNLNFVIMVRCFH